MKALLQRVSHARVEVAGECVGEIGTGLLVLAGFERADDAAKVERLLTKVLDYRVFPDEQGRMNRSLREAGGGVLLVSQFTLAADTRKGLRPSFSSAAAPDAAEALYRHAVAWLREPLINVASEGRLAAAGAQKAEFIRE
jgi:D-aminoacyl-tRNA deacylase